MLHCPPRCRAAENLICSHSCLRVVIFHFDGDTPYTPRAAHCEGKQEEQTATCGSAMQARLGGAAGDLQLKGAHHCERDRNPIEFAFVERMRAFPR